MAHLFAEKAVSASSETTTTINRSIYFPGLNALRFFAASAVVFVHTEDLKALWAFPNAEGQVGWLATVGALSVSFFFVLSGFLITYLLFVEKEKYDTINVSRFYMRRILRIWPLYYILVLIGFFVLNQISIFRVPLSAQMDRDMPLNFILYAAFVPNIAASLRMLIPYINQLWSIGVEEQFYLFWPLMVKFLRPQRVLLALFFVIGLMASLRLGASYIRLHPAAQVICSESTAKILESFFGYTRLGNMAIGGLGAFLIRYYPARMQQVVNHRWLELMLLFVLVVLVATDFTFHGLSHEIYAVIFCYLIISISWGTRSALRLEGPSWTFFGNISYGIYMWHQIPLLLLITAVRYLGLVDHPVGANLILYGLGLPLTVLVSALSYNYLEDYFLNLKKRFTLVRSGNH